jgi:acetyl esterase/lipase
MTIDIFYPLKWLTINFLRSLITVSMKFAGGHPDSLREPSLRLSYTPTTARRPRPLALHIYLPESSTVKPTARLPVHVNVHGSGFCLNVFGADAAFCGWLACSVPCVVVDIDHRKAPEHPWPAGPDDVRDAVRRVREIAETQGWDANRVSLGGFSSGANLALVEASRHRESGERLICSVLAFYPSLGLSCLRCRASPLIFSP